MVNSYLAQRATHSHERLAQLRKKLLEIGELQSLPGLSIYVTGSYGRLEASLRSDLDLFLVQHDIRDCEVISNTTQTLINAEIIKIARELGFPEFSNDGEYLKIHSLKEMLLNLGGSKDDASNHFTARLLLLLESRPVFNDGTYDLVMTEIVDAYFRDYHDHETNFRPIFLVNDILRFWKTLCLNYENKRNIPTGDLGKKNKAYLRNLKIKFSRLLTCFATVIPLSAVPKISPQEITVLVKTPPLSRLRNFVENDDAKQRIFMTVVDDYGWFLEQSARTDAESWIGDRGNRGDAFARARQFGSSLYALLQEATKSTDSLRYLVM